MIWGHLPQEVPSGHTILTKGAPLDGIYILESGIITVHDAEVRKPAGACVAMTCA